MLGCKYIRKPNSVVASLLMDFLSNSTFQYRLLELKIYSEILKFEPTNITRIQVRPLGNIINKNAFQ